MFALRLNWWYMFSGLVQSQTSHSVPAQFSHQPRFLVPLTSPVHWQGENLESQANILIFHTPTQWCGTCFDTSQSKALPSTASKPHRRNKEHSGRLRELLSDGKKKWCKRENKKFKDILFLLISSKRRKWGQSKRPTPKCYSLGDFLISQCYYVNSLRY